MMSEDSEMSLGGVELREIAGSLVEQPSVSLQSKDHQSLLDIIDKLRSQGISKYTDLPEIAVCGEQSAGKSSVLEAISGLKFPAQDNLCTRFATELILRRSQDTTINISIIHGNDEQRSDEEKEKIRSFSFALSPDKPDLGKVIEAAKEAMGIRDEGKVFSSDILRIEMSGPSQPHLTLVDLPGLFQAGSRSQSDADSETVKKLVLSYMERPRSIILAVVSAKSDFNNQIITRHAREIDPNGERTLGLITKPDTLDEGSESEKFYIKLAQNNEVHFRLGWHVLRNRDYKSKDASQSERDRKEEEFFSRGVWTSLEPTQVGVASLKPRLGKVLQKQILTQLPSVFEQIGTGIEDCKRRLGRLGVSRGNAMEQRKYLYSLSTEFSKLLQIALDGPYYNKFFGDAKIEEGFRKRLRAVIQNTLIEFGNNMRSNGHAQVISENPPNEDDRNISRDHYLEGVKWLMTRSRGRGLPGTFDPLIVGELFRQQCEPWKDIVERLSDDVMEHARHAVTVILRHTADEETAEEILQLIVNPAMEEVKNGLNNKIEEILQPHYGGHPITFNSSLIANVQKAQSERRKRDIDESFKAFFGENYAPGVKSVEFDMIALRDALNDGPIADMDRYACSSALDMMEAYYKVALDKVIDDVRVLAVEETLVKNLELILRADTLMAMGDDLIQDIAGESDESLEERKRCTEKKKVLEEGLKELRRLDRFGGHSA